MVWLTGLVAATVLGLTVAAADQGALGGAGDVPGQAATALFEPGSGEPSSSSAGSKIEDSYGKLPLTFEPTAAGEPADFLARGSGYAAFLHAGDATLSLSHLPAAGAAESATTDEGLALRIGLVGANPAEPQALRRLPGEVNYIKGNDAANWRTEVPTFERVRYPHAWPGIDVLYYGTQGRLEYDFALAPGADPEQIALRFAGQDGLRIAPNGDLVLTSEGRSLRQAAPVAYQRIGGERQAIESAYALRPDGTVGIDVGTYDHGRALVIDPIVLTYSTYLGGSSIDEGYGIAVDSTGAAYVVGRAFSTNFPTSEGAFDTTENGDADAFVAKLDPDGSALDYSTYLGGSNHDTANGISVDSAGAAYLVGYTSSTDFPTTEGAFDTTDNAGIDAYATKLDPGGSLDYSTYLGGSGDDFGFGIAVDSAGAAYLIGYTQSANFPTTEGALDPTDVGFSTFATKLDPDGSALDYSTYLGGSSGDVGIAIAVDSAGAAYLTGYTFSTNFPTTEGAFDTTDNPGGDAFATKLNPGGSALDYSTYLGASDFEEGQGIAVDSSGAAYLTGATSSTGFPTTAGAFDTTYNGGPRDTFATKLNPGGSALDYSTYLGGVHSELGREIAVDSAGAAYLTGETSSTDFPTTEGAFDTTSASNDAFATKLNPGGSALDYSTYLGGSNIDFGSGIAVDSSGGIYVTGYSGSPGLPTTNGAFDESHNGADDAFVAKFSVQPPQADLSITKADDGDPVDPGDPVRYTITVTNDGPDDASGVTVQDPLPDGSTFVAMDSDQGICVHGAVPGEAGGVSCSLGGLADGASTEIRIDITAASTDMTNTATVSSPDDEITENNSATATTEVNQPPQLATSPDSLSFPDTPVGSTSPAQTITVTNPGGGQLNISAVQITGTDASDFEISSEDCTGAAIGPADDCEISVTFTPIATGARSAALQITSDAASSPDTVPLDGTGDALRCRGLEVTIYGTNGADTIDGTGGPDVVHALGGDDTLTLRAGNDKACAGGGLDVAYGGNGNDLIRGGDDGDSLFGNGDDDRLLGLAGDDSLYGGPGGSDSCEGGAGSADTAASTCESITGVP